MAKGKFKLIDPKDNSVTTVLLNAANGGGILQFNAGNKKIVAKGSQFNGLPVATQKELQTVYDDGPQYAKMIEAPKGYVAPWQTQGNASEEE